MERVIWFDERPDKDIFGLLTMNAPESASDAR